MNGKIIEDLIIKNKIKQMKVLTKTRFLLLIFAMLTVFLFSVRSMAQQEERPDNPTTWKYFKILANADDDSVFSKIQDDLNIDPKLGSYTVIVNILDPNSANWYVVIGDEADATALRFSWTQIKKDNQDKLIAWTGANKENLNKKKYNYGSVFLDAIKKIRVKEIIAPPKKEREIISTTSYINPYFNFFGGDPLGIPLKKSFGFSFQFGTPYSGPFETDLVGANFHLLGAKVGITTRIKEFVLKHANGYFDPTGLPGQANSTFGNYNNIVAPRIGLQAGYVLPFGNFFEISYFAVIDTAEWDPLLLVPNQNGDLAQPYMPNIIKNQGSYMNFELRYPFRTFGSTRAKIYVAKYFGEIHIGYMGRELRLAGSVFDLRLDYVVDNPQRNWQFLGEIYISNIAEGFGLNSFALGPSVRLTRSQAGGIGIVTAMLNARFKLGDFFDEK
ncbi:MAG: hypothetical protein NTV87_09120 [Ignavibacteriae bacterium]|nr:hypothetical protein [Ignavibacteriota bacterium]